MRIYQRLSHVASTSALLLVALAAAAPSFAVGQQLVLTADVSKTEFFEGEPIYFLLRLQNVGTDTAWTYPFRFTSPAMTLSVKVGQGKPFDLAKPIVHYSYLGTPEPPWRGEPLPPRASILRTMVLQTIMGDGRSIRDHLFGHHLAPDHYELRIVFHAHWGLPRTTPLTVTTAPVVFRIRPGTTAETEEVRELEGMRQMGWDTTRVAGYPRAAGYNAALICWVERRVSTQPDDPFLPFLLYNGLYAVGQVLATQILAGEVPRFDPDTSEVVRQLRLAVIERHRFSTSGAHLVQGLSARHPDQLAILAEQLSATPAGEMARYHVERNQHGQQVKTQSPR